VTSPFGVEHEISKGLRRRRLTREQMIHQMAVEQVAAQARAGGHTVTVYKKAYDYSGGKRVGHKDWDHPTTGMVRHAGREAYDAGKLRPLHPSTYRRAGRDERAGKAAVRTLGSYQGSKDGRYSKQVFAHSHEGETWHSIGTGRDQHFYRGQFTPDKVAS
jgi:hypothetical protein